MKLVIIFLVMISTQSFAAQVIDGNQYEILVSIDESTTTGINLDMTNRCYQVYGNGLPSEGDRASSVSLFDGILSYNGTPVGSARILHAVISYELSISMSNGFAIHTYTCKFGWE